MQQLIQWDVWPFQGWDLLAALQRLAEDQETGSPGGVQDAAQRGSFARMVRWSVPGLPRAIRMEHKGIPNSQLWGALQRYI